MANLENKKVFLIPENLYREGFGGEDRTPVDLDVVSKCRKFIKGLWKKTKTINKQRSSYGLKHVVERALGEYVANGDLIAAMILEGYVYERMLSINAKFNVSESSVNKSDPAVLENNLQKGYYKNVKEAVCGFLEYNDTDGTFHIGTEKEKYSPSLSWKLIQPFADDECLFNIDYYVEFIERYGDMIELEKPHYKDVRKKWFRYTRSLRH